VVVATLALVLPAAACSDGPFAESGLGPGANERNESSAAASSAAATADPAATSADASADPTTDDPTGVPQAIVSLSPTATEMLFAIGAGPQVVAVDDQSDFPVDAPVTDLSGFTPNVESILGYSPDLVVLSDGSDDVTKALEAAGVQTLVLPAATVLEDSYTQIEQLGAVTGHVGDAAELVGQMQSDIERIVSSLPERQAPIRYFHELDDTYYTVTSATFIGDVYSRLGMQSIADSADGAASNPYPQLSQEFIVSANPDVILLADSQCCGVTPDSVRARPGWSSVSAVRGDRIVVLDEDVASRWGPRIVDFMRTVAETVAADQPVG
jgi:iron complex transport system substrate-binding protein